MNIYPLFWKNASSKRKRIYSAIPIFVIAVLLTVLGTLVPLSPQDAKHISDSTNQTIVEGTANGTLAVSIFINNFSLCLLMFIPVIGTILGLFIMFDTGVAIGAIISVQSTTVAPGAAANIQATTAILVLVLAGLTFLLEYVSYAIGITESIWLFRRLTQRRWRELKNTAILIGICALLLTIGAIVEAWAISLPI
jgi:hypothetical protein